MNKNKLTVHDSISETLDRITKNLAEIALEIEDIKCAISVRTMRGEFDDNTHTEADEVAREFKDAVQGIVNTLGKAYTGFEHLHVDAGGKLQAAIDKFEEGGG